MRLSIRTKLAAGLLLIVGMTALLFAGGLWAVVSYRQTIKDLDEQLDLVGKLADLRSCLHAMSAPSAKEVSAEPARLNPLRQQIREALGHLTAYEEARRRAPASAPDAWALQAEVQHLESLRRDLLTLEQQIARAESLHRNVLLSLVVLPAMRGTLRELRAGASELMLDTHTYAARLIDAARPRYRRSLAIVVVAAAGTVGLVICLVMLGYRWLVQPLHQLADGVQQLRAGNFDHVITLRTGDEMEELAREFNAMTAQLHDEHRHLEQQVAEKSKQLMRSQRLASLGLLAAGVAHEINNPLASIAGCAEALAGRLRHDGAPPGEDAAVIQQYLKTIQDEAFRCKEITRRLLSLAPAGPGTVEDTDLNTLVDDVIATVQHLHTARGKTIQFQRGHAVLCRVNPLDIKQVVLNLTVNALDSMKPGGTLRIATRRENGQAVLVLADDGCGLTPEQIERIFEPFYTLKPVGKGTGLGLSICHNIVDQYGGRIVAESPGLGRGATFTVVLPCP